MRCLLTTNHLRVFGGSEIVLFEMVEALAERGWQIDVLANTFEPDFVAPLLSLGAVVTTDPAQFDYFAYDMIYIQHPLIGLIFPQAIPDAPATLPFLVFNHLSPYEPYEAPGAFIECRHADAILANSLETRDRLVEFGVDPSRIAIWPNPAPPAFRSAPRAPRRQFASLVVVSNHVPAEVHRAIALLRSAGVRVTLIGQRGARKRVMPLDLLVHDAVMTIGKTVQYALAARRPVFCYDHFGGPGWLLPANFAPAAACNFSGRSHPDRLTADELAAAVTDGFAAADAFAQHLDDDLAAPFHLTAHLDALLDRMRDLASDAGRIAAFLARANDPAARTDVLRERAAAELLRREVQTRQGNVRSLANALRALDRTTDGGNLPSPARMISDAADALTCVFSSTDTDLRPSGATRLTRLGTDVIVRAADADPRCIVLLQGAPAPWLFLTLEIVLDAEATLQVFTRVTGETAVVPAHIAKPQLGVGTTTVSVLLARDGDIDLVRVDPIDRPGVAVLRSLKIYAPRPAFT